ncbi:hypothetical protein HOE04_03340 [archaeon]|jgi:hypothetical protein|nr:hypothetical protein [archaeon]
MVKEKKKLIEKRKSIFDSWWFNVIMGVVAVVALGDNIVVGYQSGSYQYIRIVIWVVLSYHFIREVVKKR